MQDAPKAVWSILYRYVVFLPSLKQYFIVYRSSKVSDCIFGIHQLWQSGFSRVYSNCCWRCSFEPEIRKIGQSSHNMYSNNILNFQESKTILNTHTKIVWKLIESTTYNNQIVEENFARIGRTLTTRQVQVGLKPCFLRLRYNLGKRIRQVALGDYQASMESLSPQFCTGWNNLDNQASSSRPKTVDSEVMLQPRETNPASNTQRVSGELGISQCTRLVTFTYSTKVSGAVEWRCTLPKYYITSCYCIHFCTNAPWERYEPLYFLS